MAEPTLLNIVNAHKGVARWLLETSGRACHSSRPEQGVNAVYRMVRLLRGVEEYATKLQQSPARPGVGPADGLRRPRRGRRVGKYGSRCLLRHSRSAPAAGESFETATADLDAFLRALPGVDFPFTLGRSAPGCLPLSPTESVELVQRLGQVIDSVVGRHTVHSVPFGTDASRIASASVPSVVFGPGDIAQAHTKDEWIDLAQLEPAAEILFRFACGK